MVSERLRQEGFDAVFVPKGYDQTLLSDQGRERDIELAFVGSTNSVAYSGRKALLDELGQVENLVVTRTKSGEEYCDTLNRIRFFVSADVGMGEYMIKNFEAMACGCVLFAYDQGEAENLAQRIAVNGRDLAVSQFGFGAIGARIVRELEPALRIQAPASWMEKLRAALGI
jgi:hypothetical protein